jgi:hypothetical protein
VTSHVFRETCATQDATTTGASTAVQIVEDDAIFADLSG